MCSELCDIKEICLYSSHTRLSNNSGDWRNVRPIRPQHPTTPHTAQKKKKQKTLLTWLKKSKHWYNFLIKETLKHFIKTVRVNTFHLYFRHNFKEEVTFKVVRTINTVIGEEYHVLYLICCCLVAQLCPTLCNPMDCSPPGSSIHSILQARILEWVAISFFWGSSWPRDWIRLLLGRQVLNRN